MHSLGYIPNILQLLEKSFPICSLFLYQIFHAQLGVTIKASVRLMWNVGRQLRETFCAHSINEMNFLPSSEFPGMFENMTVEAGVVFHGACPPKI